MTADLTIINASNGSGEAVRSLVTVTRSAGATVITVDALTNWPAKGIATTGTLDTNGRLTSSTIQVLKFHTSGSTLVIDGFAPGYTDKGNAIGDVVVIKPTTLWADTIADDINGLSTGASILPTANISLNNLTVTGALTVNNASSNAGWYPLLPLPTISSIAYNGNRSYTINATPTQAAILSPGMRLRTTRTVAAPTQSTSLNGTTQYYSKTSPAGMTFTNNFVVSAWVKLSSYSSNAMVIASRYNGTSGFTFKLNNSDGRVMLVGFNGGAANFSYVISYQSIPLNKWVHVTAQLDMATFTATSSTSYIMIDGVDVPASVARGGTNPTALIQAGNLEIGSENGGTNLFPGKIAQAAIYNAKVSEATIQATISQGLAGTETSLISAYSFNNSINDLNANGNNLTANGSAVATNADSPFGGQADGTISSTLDYGIVQKITSTTITVQVPEGCTIPTTGGVSAVSYSGVRAPYGFPGQRGKWRINSIKMTDNGTTSNATYGSYMSGGWILTVPIGEYNVGWTAGCMYDFAVAPVTFNLSSNTSIVGLSEAAGNLVSPLSARIQAPSAVYLGVSANVVPQQQSLAAQTVYTMYSVGSTTSAGIDGGKAIAEIYAENAYL